MTTGTQIKLIGRRYQLLDPIGAGGMGTVFRAMDRLTGGTVALKRVTATAEDLQFASRTDDSVDLRLALAQEFRTLASLRHPHIISVLDYGFDQDKQPFFTMKLLENAQGLIEAGSLLSTSERVGLLVQLLQALVYLHRRGVIHRDLKPSNVLVVDGRVQILDFGISLMQDQTREIGKTLSGTLAYMAPEAFLEQPITESVDLYAVGVMAYEMFANQHPFATMNITDLLQTILYATPDMSLVPVSGKLRAVIAQLLSKAPEFRYGSAVETITAFSDSIDQPVPAETAETRESFLQAARLTGRDTELATLSTLLMQALNGQGSAWLVGGESGVGKSRLMDEIHTLAMVRGALILRGQTVNEGGLPYQLWYESLRWLAILSNPTDEQAAILKPIVTDVGALLERDIPAAPELDPKQAQERLLSTIAQLITDLIKQQNQPTVILLEDLQWAEESLILLNRLNELTAQLPLLILATYRDDERPTLPAELPGMQVIKLNRLSESGIANLSASILGEAGRQPQIVEMLQRETEGNVFFLIEIVRTLAEEAGQLDKVDTLTLPKHILTGGIKRIIESRLASVPTHDRGLLEIAAVAGRRLDLAVLKALALGIDLDQWLITCANLAVLELQDYLWRFTHDKIREGLLSTLTPERNREINRVVAVAIEAAYPDPANFAGNLAYHWGVAGGAAKEAHYAVMAADTLGSLNIYGKARSYYEKAMAALKRLPDTPENQRTRIDTTFKYLYAAWGATPPEEILHLLQEVEPLAKALSDGDGAAGRLRLGRVHYWLGRALFNGGRLREAIGYHQQVLAVGQEFNDAELIAIPSGTIGQVVGVQGYFGKSMALLTQASNYLEQTQNWGEWVRVTGYLCGAMLGTGRPYSEALKVHDRGLAKSLELKNVISAGAYYIYSASFFMNASFPALSLHSAEECRRLSEESGDRLFTYLGYGFKAWAESRLGEHQHALESMNTSKQIADSLGGRVILIDWFSVAEAEMAFNAGHHEEALVLAERAFATAQATGSIFTQGVAQRIWGHALLKLNRFTEAEAHLNTSIQYFDQGEGRLHAARSHGVLGMLYAAQHQNAKAREHLQNAINQLEISGLEAEVIPYRQSLAEI